MDVLDTEVWHEFKNQFGIVVTHSELLLRDLDLEDSRRDNLREIHSAVICALELLPRLQIDRRLRDQQ